ncbi:hypothetical protein KIN20_024995 [Parelaphostrongylus tenuis]|uniref:Uncharacterized protein n=1 Tax=Parelaphostrongylus tenuis TaxID=148309 RepID=A0AAD5N8S8_PARTN|nr:hypothetical protein KIN20_024995 [Parelaphostrongylus tenuis]
MAISRLQSPCQEEVGVVSCDLPAYDEVGENEFCPLYKQSEDTNRKAKSFTEIGVVDYIAELGRATRNKFGIGETGESEMGVETVLLNSCS